MEWWMEGGKEGNKNENKVRMWRERERALLPLRNCGLFVAFFRGFVLSAVGRPAGGRAVGGPIVGGRKEGKSG